MLPRKGAETRESPVGSPPGSRSLMCATRAPIRCSSLDLDVGADLFELGLGRLGLVLAHLLEQRLGGAVDQVLRVLQAHAEQVLDDLDDLDLLGAGTVEHEVELALLVGATVVATTGGGCGGHDGGRGSGGHVELLFEGVEELLELDDGHVGNCVEDLVLGHWVLSFETFGAISPWGMWGDRTQAASRSEISALRPNAKLRGSACSRPAVLTSGAWNEPASCASSTSRDGRLARTFTSSADMMESPIIPPLTTRAGVAFDWSVRAFAVAATSPVTNVRAVGPLRCSWSPSIPAAVAASLTRVFLNTLCSAPASRKGARRSANCAT